jgi:hypothetical protein
VYIKNGNYWTFFHKKVKTVNSTGIFDDKLRPQILSGTTAKKLKQLIETIAFQELKTQP